MDQAAEIQALFTDDSDSLHFDHGTLFSHSASPHQHFQIMGKHIKNAQPIVTVISWLQCTYLMIFIKTRSLFYEHTY